MASDAAARQVTFATELELGERARMGDAPASVESDSPSTSTPAPAPLNFRIAEKLIGAWHRGYLLLKPIEKRVEAARTKVVELLVAAVMKEFVSKYGKLTIIDKETTDWEALARAMLNAKVVDGLAPAYTTKSKPYTRAPTTWAGEAKK